MSLKAKIAARLKAKAAGVNLSQTRIATVVARAEKGGLTDESDDTAIDAQLDIINELTPFTEMASFDDHQRAKEAKTAQDKETARLKAIEEGKTPPVDDPNETPTEKLLKQALAGITALTAEVANIKGEKVANTRKSRYEKALEGAPDAFKTNALEDFEMFQFRDEDHFEEWLGKKSEAAKVVIQEESNNGLGNERPAGGAGGKPAGTVKEASAAEVDAAVESII